MYVTRPLSLLKRCPDLLNKCPQEGPNSGYLVLFDEECKTKDRFGHDKTSIRGLPFPQNKTLTVTYYDGDSAYYDVVAFLPVLGEPLSSNTYYVIKLTGKHVGEACASSKEEDKKTRCCCTFVKDAKPRPLDPLDIYQQFKVLPIKHGKFAVVSLAPDGYPPLTLRNNALSVDIATQGRLFSCIDEALGLDSSLRACLPSLNDNVVVVVGKWYCPFAFVKEDRRFESLFYEMTLEQRWERIFGRERGVCDGQKMTISIDVLVEVEEVFVGGKRGVCEAGKKSSENGMVWFKSCDGVERLGLSMKVVERMKWEQERVGWVDGRAKEKQVRVERREEFGRSTKAGWTKFGCYVLVERFVLKRGNDKSIALAYDFKHTHQIRCKWE